MKENENEKEIGTGKGIEIGKEKEIEIGIGKERGIVEKDRYLLVITICLVDHYNNNNNYPVDHR